MLIIQKMMIFKFFPHFNSICWELEFDGNGGFLKLPGEL